MDYQISNYLYKTATYLYVTKQTGSSAATGLFFKFNNSDEPVLITNRHVFEDANYVVVTTRAKHKNISAQLCIQIPQDASPVFHPSPSVDLAMLKLKGTVPPSKGLSVHDLDFTFVSESMIPTTDEWESLHFVEDVLMFGCPNGIWNAKYALPVARKGITATPANSHLWGNDNFQLDIGSYPGSSGSPVFLCTDEAMNKIASARLLGVFFKAQYRGPEQYIHLGQAIPSTKILDFKQFIK